MSLPALVERVCPILRTRLGSEVSEDALSAMISSVPSTLGGFVTAYPAILSGVADESFDSWVVAASALRLCAEHFAPVEDAVTASEALRKATEDLIYALGLLPQERPMFCQWLYFVEHRIFYGLGV